MATTSNDQLIPLTGGFAPRLSVLTWCLDASWRLTMRVEPDGSLFVGPRSLTTPDDLAFIRAHRDEVIACVRYTDVQAARPL